MPYETLQKVATPLRYTQIERGMWRVWEDGPIDLSLLKTGERTITLNGISIHALAFENPSFGWGYFARWDSLNGWTTTIEDARQKRRKSGIIPVL